jgi:hypothetical protein
VVIVGDLIAVAIGADDRTWLPARARRRLAVALALATAMTCLTPSGPALLLFPFHTISAPTNQYIIEWQPTSLTSPMSAPYALFLLGYLALILIRRPRLTIADMLLGCIFLTAGLTRIRFVSVSSLMLLFLAGRALALPDASGIRIGRLAATAYA